MCIVSYVQMNVFGIIILYFFYHNQQKSGSASLEDNLINGILIVLMIEQAMDAGQWALEGAFFPGSRLLQWFCYSAGYAVAPAITCLWLMYCDVRIYMDERGLRKRIPLYLIPCFLNAALVIVNLFVPLLFHIDEANAYHRDGCFSIYMVLMYLYGITSLLMVIRKASQPDYSLERMEYRYMALFIFPPLIAGLL